MTIQDLGNLGELIAAVATIATLAYLAIEERLRFKSFFQTTFRRMEAVHVLSTLESIDGERVRDFELSILTTLHSPGAGEWWRSARVTFDRAFADHVDAWLERNPPTGPHPSLGIPTGG